MSAWLVTSNTVLATAAPTAHRHRGEITRPSGNHSSPMENAETPPNAHTHPDTQPAKTAAGNEPGASINPCCAYMKQNNVKALAVPMNRYNQPRRFPRRCETINAPRQLNPTASGMSSNAAELISVPQA